MTLDSSNDTVAILYDIENAPIEMLQYTIDKAQRYQPCRMIVVSDWEAHPEQKRWDRLMQYPDFTFRQISRTYFGKNSLDSALYDSAQMLYQEGVRKYFIITTDSDFVRIAESLNAQDPSYIIGVGTKQASEDLRSAYNEFFVYPPERKAKGRAAAKKNTGDKNTEADKVAKKKTDDKAVKSGQKPAADKATKTAEQKKKAAGAGAGQKKQADAPAEPAKAVKEAQKSAPKTKKNAQPKKTPPAAPAAPAESAAPASAVNGFLTVRLPKTLRTSLEQKMREEEVSLDELVTYLLMRGLSVK